MIKHLASAVLFGAFACGAVAQTMKPGLWEVSTRMQSSSGQMEQGMAQMREQMANMPPEQRKMAEDMMKQRGMSMEGGAGGGAGGGSMRVKVCITKEMAERKEIPSQRGDCKTTRHNAGANTMRMAFTCTNPPSSGEGEVTFPNPESYQMKMVVNTTAQGRPEKMNMDGSGRWLASDCGDIKPMTGK